MTKPFIAVWAEARTDQRGHVMGDSTKPSGLPWAHSREDLQHFRETTRGHTLIMGRKTFDLLPPILKTHKATQERPIIVLTSEADRMRQLTRGAEIQPLSWVHPGASAAKLVRILNQPFTHHWSPYCDNPVAVIGGPAVIELFSGHYTQLVVTHIPGQYRGDTFAPTDAFFDDFKPTYRKRLADGFTTVSYHTPKENHA